MLAGMGMMTGSPVAWGFSVGILPGIIDLVGLGLRLPLWAKLNHRAAVLSMNLRFVSRLVLLGVYFYALHRFTHVPVRWALGGIFIPHVIYLVWVVWQHKGKGVNQ